MWSCVRVCACRYEIFKSSCEAEAGSVSALLWSLGRAGLGSSNNNGVLFCRAIQQSLLSQHTDRSPLIVFSCGCVCVCVCVCPCLDSSHTHKAEWLLSDNDCNLKCVVCRSW